ncbi:MAG TPA: hypothetical protein VE133_19650 [Candidatus Sulfotelmatobacter sp.]|nr:hypothetical protein [Candidatus Sulfotelmatobacter sp.]
MVNWIPKSFFLLILGCVLLVFIAPSVDLPDTVLSNQQGLYCVLCVILVEAAIFTSMTSVFQHEKEELVPRSTPRLYPLLCTFLC